MSKERWRREGDFSLPAGQPHSLLKENFLRFAAEIVRTPVRFSAEAIFKTLPFDRSGISPVQKY
jgi:hypothetical protein